LRRPTSRSAPAPFIAIVARAAKWAGAIWTFIASLTCQAAPIESEPLLLATRFLLGHQFSVKPTATADIGALGSVDADTGTIAGGEFSIRAPGDFVPELDYKALFKNFPMSASISGKSIAVDGKGVTNREEVIPKNRIGKGGSVIGAANKIVGMPPAGLVQAGGIGSWTFTAADGGNVPARVFDVVAVGQAQVDAFNAADPNQAQAAVSITHHLRFPKGQIQIRPALDLGFFSTRTRAGLAFDATAKSNLIGNAALWSLHVEVAPGFHLSADFHSASILGLTDDDVERNLLEAMNPADREQPPYETGIPLELFDIVLESDQAIDYSITTTGLAVLRISEPSAPALLGLVFTVVVSCAIHLASPRAKCQPLKPASPALESPQFPTETRHLLHPRTWLAAAKP